MLPDVMDDHSGCVDDPLFQEDKDSGYGTEAVRPELAGHTERLKLVGRYAESPRPGWI